MFGYVTPLKPEMKIREYETFRAYYCGVCMHIKENFGNIPRMTLNYDMTFLAMLLDALHNEGPKFEMKRCIAHPHSRRGCMSHRVGKVISRMGSNCRT